MEFDNNWRVAIFVIMIDSLFVGMQKMSHHVVSSL